MRLLTDALDLAGVALAVAAAVVLAGFWAGLAVGSGACLLMSWSLSRTPR